jgi:hypothetical protein
LKRVEEGKKAEEHYTVGHRAGPKMHRERRKEKGKRRKLKGFKGLKRTIGETRNKSSQ